MTEFTTDFVTDDAPHAEDGAGENLVTRTEGAGEDPATRTEGTGEDPAARTEAEAPLPERPQSLHRPQNLDHQTSDHQTSDHQNPDYRRLAALIDQAWDLAREGGLSPAATDAQKWQAGDLVGAMGRAVAAARDRVLDPVIPVTPEAHVAYRACASAYDAFLGAQGLARGTLVDAGLTAATFPPGHPIRLGPLSFSHARTLTRLRSEGARSAWAARAAREGLSVARLQTLLNIEGPSGAGFGPSEGTGRLTNSERLTAPERLTDPEYPLLNGRPSRQPRPRHGHVCTLTGAPIVDLSSMVELRLDPEAAEGFDLSAVTERASPRGGAALPGPNGSPPRFPLLLRFAGLSALARWLTARRRE